MKSKNGVEITFTKGLHSELIGDFSSDLSPNLERMRASKTSFTADEFIEAIIVGYECGISPETLILYLDTLDFDAVVVDSDLMVKNRVTDGSVELGEHFTAIKETLGFTQSNELSGPR